ncbi:MAG: prepilin-type N-terminal cleavage/methylation domain-containing protein [Desulfuromonadales bacterium]|nr:prepilin-type N-terminal cleavage/methylation domain-containing protein [Desulfuromonadales bacterium]
MNQKGFTMIELVVVIVILGILAAVAVPKFIDLQTEARTASLQGTLGAMKAASAMTYAKALVNGVASEASSSVTVNGAAVPTAFGYPEDGDALILVMNDIGNMTQDGTDPNLFTDLSGATPANCSVEYVPAADADTAASFNDDTAGC